MVNDLTNGSPFRVILKFSIPLLISTALQQLYNIVDSVIVGQFTGSSGLAAIGAAYPVTLFYIAVATGTAMGCSVVISQLFGAQRYKELKSAVSTALISLAVFGAVLALAGVLLARPLMLLLRASGETLDGSSVYLAIYSAGVLPMLIYNAASSVFTGLGNPRLPLLLLLFSSVLNIVLDLVAVAVMGLGVLGAAWATTISQLAAAVLACVLLFTKLRKTFTEIGSQAFSGRLFREMTRIAVPCIFQQACVALAHTIVQSIVNTYSTSVIAGYEAASKLHNFAYMSFNTLGTALSTFVAQNHGAGKSDRIIKGYNVSTLICFVLTLVVIALMQIFPRQLLGIFTDSGAYPEVITTGVKFLRIISPDYLLICLIITTGGYLRGVGRARDFFLLTVMDFAIRVAMCFALTKWLNSYTGLFWAWYCGSAADCLLCFIIWLRAVRRRDRALA
ncbi:MAG: MATE family efflux transporter [Oscillospiraceae bacterium]|nr:MATE family efflux transporter [Oscillospiraceae bacterium]